MVYDGEERREGSDLKVDSERNISFIRAVQFSSTKKDEKKILLNVETEKKLINTFPEETDERETKTKDNNHSPIKRKKVFTPPFETYYYRDLIWKVNYSNRFTV